MSPEFTFHQTGSAFFWSGFLLITAAGACGLLLGLLVLLQSSAPDFLARASGALRERPLVSLGLGVALVAGLVGLAAVGKSVPPVGAFAVGTFATLGLFALAASAEHLGRRVAWISGRDGSRVSNLAIGWLVLFGASCVPYVGWFLVLPWALTSGLGALALGVSRPRAGKVIPE
ncbi:MAG TPA: hypothetical protein VFC90_10370 [Planctomycetota bacterium]|nr:hypothetical protein [Planctomycetota bacterium]